MNGEQRFIESGGERRGNEADSCPSSTSVSSCDVEKPSSGYENQGSATRIEGGLNLSTKKKKMVEGAKGDEKTNEQKTGDAEVVETIVGSSDNTLEHNDQTKPLTLISEEEPDKSGVLAGLEGKDLQPATPNVARSSYTTTPMNSPVPTPSSSMSQKAAKDVIPSPQLQSHSQASTLPDISQLSSMIDDAFAEVFQEQQSFQRRLDDISSPSSKDRGTHRSNSRPNKDLLRQNSGSSISLGSSHSQSAADAEDEDDMLRMNAEGYAASPPTNVFFTRPSLQDVQSYAAKSGASPMDHRKEEILVDDMENEEEDSSMPLVPFELHMQAAEVTSQTGAKKEKCNVSLRDEYKEAHAQLVDALPGFVTDLEKIQLELCLSLLFVYSKEEAVASMAESKPYNRTENISNHEPSSWNNARKWSRTQLSNLASDFSGHEPNAITHALNSSIIELLWSEVVARTCNLHTQNASTSSNGDIEPDKVDPPSVHRLMDLANAYVPFVELVPIDAARSRAQIDSNLNHSMEEGNSSSEDNALDNKEDTLFVDAVASGQAISRVEVTFRAIRENVAPLTYLFELRDKTDTSIDKESPSKPIDNETHPVLDCWRSVIKTLPRTLAPVMSLQMQQSEYSSSNSLSSDVELSYEGTQTISLSPLSPLDYVHSILALACHRRLEGEVFQVPYKRRQHSIAWKKDPRTSEEEFKKDDSTSVSAKAQDDCSDDNMTNEARRRRINRERQERQNAASKKAMDIAALERYALVQLPKHWFMSGLYTHSLYLLYHNMEYVSHRIVGELRYRKHNTDYHKYNPQLYLGTMKLWMDDNLLSVLVLELLHELETWFDDARGAEAKISPYKRSDESKVVRKVSSLEASSIDAAFIKVLGFWCHALMISPQDVDEFVSASLENAREAATASETSSEETSTFSKKEHARRKIHNHFEILKQCSLACQRAGTFLGALADSAVQRVLPTIRKEIELDYFLQSLDWRNRALWYASTNILTLLSQEDIQVVLAASAGKSSGARSTPGSASASILVASSPSSSTAAQSPTSSTLMLDNLAKSPSQFDLLHIIAILPGHLNAASHHVLDLVDEKGMHLVLPYTKFVLMLCRQTGKMLNSLAVHWYSVNNATHALSSFSGAHELLWLSDVPTAVNGVLVTGSMSKRSMLSDSTPLSDRSVDGDWSTAEQNDAIDLELSDGLAAPAFTIDEEKESSEGENPRDEETEEGESRRMSARNNSRKDNKRRPYGLLPMMGDVERWATLSSIELHRGMLHFSSDLKAALSSFQHAKDYLHRSDRTLQEELEMDLSTSYSITALSPNAALSSITPWRRKEETPGLSRLHHFEKLSTIYSWIASTYRELGEVQLALEFFHESMEYTQRCVQEATAANDTNNNYNSNRFIATASSGGDKTNKTEGGEDKNSPMVPWVYQLHLANVLFNMAVTLDDMAMYKQSLSRYNEAYSILSNIWDQHCGPPSSPGVTNSAGKGDESDTASAHGSLRCSSLLSDASQSVSSTSASVMGDMLEIWLCIGNLYLRSHEDENNNSSFDGDPNSPRSRRQAYKTQKEALLYFIQGLILFVNKWCQSGVPQFNADDASSISMKVESVLGPKGSEPSSSSRLVVDSDGQWMHLVSDLMADISLQVQQTDMQGDDDSENESQSIGHPYQNILMSVNTQKKHQYAPIMAALSSFVEQVQEEEAVLQRVRRLVEYAQETLSSVMQYENSLQGGNERANKDISGEASKSDAPSNNKTDLIAYWSIIADACYEVNDFELALDCLKSSLGGEDNCKLSDLLGESDDIYRFAMCFLRLHQFADAELYFQAFIDEYKKEESKLDRVSARRKGDAYFHLGHVQAQLGKFKNAIDSYRHSLDIRNSDTSWSTAEGTSGNSEDVWISSMRESSLIANTYHETAIVYLLNCSMNFDEFSGVSLNAIDMDEDGCQSTLSVEQAKDYLELSIKTFRDTVFGKKGGDGKHGHIVSYGVDIVTYAIAAKHLAVLCRLRHEWTAAEEWFQQALDVLDLLPKCTQASLETANVSYEWGVLCSLKNSAREVGQSSVSQQSEVTSLDSAENLMRRALRLYQETEEGKLTNQVQLARIWFNLGRIQLQKDKTDGSTSKAKISRGSSSSPVEFLEKALAIMGRVHPTLIQDLDESTEATEQKEPHAKPLWELLNIEFTSQLYHDVGSAHLSLGSFDVATECLETSEQLRKLLLDYSNVSENVATSVPPVANQTAEEIDDPLAGSTPTESVSNGSNMFLSKSMQAIKMARTQNNLGIAYSHMGKLDQSRLCFDRALNLRRRRREMLWDKWNDSVSAAPTYIEVEQEYATTLTNSGFNLVKLKCFETALESFESAVDIFESLLDEVDDLSWTLANLYHSIGMTHSDLNRWIDAKEAFDKSLTLRARRRPYGSKGKSQSFVEPLTHISYEEVGIQQKQFKNEEEEEDSVRVADTKHYFGIAYENLGQYQDALICYEEAWILRKLHLSRDDLSMAQSLSAMANLKVIDGGHYDVAMKYYEEALRVELLHHGPAALDVAETQYRLGMIHHVMGDYMEARLSYQSALRIYEANKMNRYRAGRRGDEESHAGMEEALEAWKELQQDFENNEQLQKSNLDWSKLSYNPRGCVGKMEEILRELLVLLEDYIIQPASEALQDGVNKAATLVNDAVVYNAQTLAPQARLPPAPPQINDEVKVLPQSPNDKGANQNTKTDAGRLSPSVHGMFDPEQELCLYLG